MASRGLSNEQRLSPTQKVGWEQLSQEERGVGQTDSSRPYTGVQPKSPNAFQLEN